ncbi:MAG: hypothetical protein R2695_03545 [Acidimicrobiales bacterium]
MLSAPALINAARVVGLRAPFLMARSRASTRKSCCRAMRPKSALPTAVHSSSISSS